MEELSEECRKAFLASKASKQAAAVRRRYLLQANMCLGSTHAGAWSLWRLLVPKKGKYGLGPKYYIGDIINWCYISSEDFWSQGSEQKH